MPPPGGLPSGLPLPGGVSGLPPPGSTGLKPTAPERGKLSERSKPEVVPKPSAKVATQRPKATKLPIPEPKVPEVGELKVGRPDPKGTTEFQRMISSLPQLTPFGGSDEAERTAKWYPQFQAYVYSILSSFVEDESVLLRMVDSQSMAIWAQAFTHETYSSDHNYESLETLGDGVLKYAFRKYLTATQTKITPAQISSLETYYMAKGFQSRTSTELGFPNWVRIGPSTMTINIVEDLFESFFGALDYVGDTIEPGKGAAYSIAFLTLIFRSVTLDVKRSLGNPKTLVNQTAERLHWGKIVEDIDERGSDVRMSIRVSDQGLRYLRDLGIEVTNPIGFGSGGTRTAASTAAYIQAFDNLYDRGLTLSVIEKLRAKIEMNEVATTHSDLVDAAKAKAVVQTGSDDLRFVIVRSARSMNKVTTQLKVVTDDDNDVVLKTVSSSSRQENGIVVRVRLLEEYLA